MYTIRGSLIPHAKIADQLDVLALRKVWLTPRPPLPFLACSVVIIAVHWHGDEERPVRAPRGLDGAERPKRESAVTVFASTVSLFSVSLQSRITARITYSTSRSLRQLQGKLPT